MSRNKKTKLELLLEILSDHQWHSGDELAAAVSWRFGAVIHDARGLGYLIETERHGQKFQYSLSRS